MYDGVNLPFEAGTFSLVTMINSFESVARPANLVADILRVSRPDVKILMTINNQSSLIKKLMRIRRGESWGKLGEWYTSYSVESLAQLIVPLGFRPPRILTYSLSSLYERAPSLMRMPMFRNKLFAENIYLEIERSRDGLSSSVPAK